MLTPFWKSSRIANDCPWPAIRPKHRCDPAPGAGGAGSSGYPNLVDDDWLWGGDVSAIHQTLVDGIRRGTDGYVKDVTATVFAAAYLPFMMGFTMLMLAAPLGPQLIIVFVCLTISNDIGGYAAGVLFGKHPIAPQVSPKKSWEGLAGSAILQSAIGAWLFVWLLDAHWWQGVVAGLVMTVTATAGDFAESAIKRDLGVKDMGTILPGHGGVMDRLDSLVPNAFVAWLLFSIFGLVPMVT